jgi:hypothetical protein
MLICARRGLHHTICHYQRKWDNQIILASSHVRNNKKCSAPWALVFSFDHSMNYLVHRVDTFVVDVVWVVAAEQDTFPMTSEVKKMADGVEAWWCGQCKHLIWASDIMRERTHILPNAGQRKKSKKQQNNLTKIWAVCRKDGTTWSQRAPEAVASGRWRPYPALLRLSTLGQHRYGWCGHGGGDSHSRHGPGSHPSSVPYNPRPRPWDKRVKWER